MTKEELEKVYYADRPTEPYSDDDSPNDWANIAHYAEENLEKAFKRISELKAYNAKLLNGDIEKHNKIVELETQIEKMKCCDNCAWWYRLPNGEKDCAEVCGNFENWSLRRKK